MDFSTSTTLPNSASPQHNPQAASVFGLHEFSFSSIEPLPNAKAAMAFVLDSGTVFREDTRLDYRVLNGGQRFVPWGMDNAMPYNIISKLVPIYREVEGASTRARNRNILPPFHPRTSLSVLSVFSAFYPTPYSLAMYSNLSTFCY